MFKIALVCQHGASTGMCVSKMRESAIRNGIEVQIDAYSDSQMENLVLEKDVILLGPQLGFKKDSFMNQYPEFANRISVIDTMDFGMMDGDKILKNALRIINEEN